MRLSDLRDGIINLGPFLVFILGLLYVLHKYSPDMIKIVDRFLGLAY